MIGNGKNNRPVTFRRVSLITSLILFWVAQSVLSQSINEKSKGYVSRGSTIQSVVDERILTELRYHFLLNHATVGELQEAQGLIYLSVNNGISQERIAFLMLIHLEKGMTPEDSLRFAEEEIIRTIMSRNTSTQLSGEALAFDPVSFLKGVEGFIGTPYLWGGASHRGTDCSGFSWNIMNDMGVHIPRMTAIAYFYSSNFIAVDRNSLQPGDLVFFRGRNGGSVNHVGIYLGNDKFAHASKGTGKVSIDDLKKSYWVRHWAGARRAI